MKSFNSELINPIVEQEIIDLANKIRLHDEGQLDTDKFVSLKKARGIYGQRQAGQQMLRVKVPYGRTSSEQLFVLADMTDKYSTGRLHLTTRQCVQVHFVSIDRTPELWADLEKNKMTIREACGNNVRNLTASETAGIDPNEVFDVTPHAEAVYQYFLRFVPSSDLGRKFKIAFSNNEDDTSQVFMHDIGFIAKTRVVDGKEVRGFRVYIGGGLGTTAIKSVLAKEFVDEDQIIPLTEAVLRVYDRYGERANRARSRIKFLIQEIGIEKFMALIDEEWLALAHKSFPIDTTPEDLSLKLSKLPAPEVIIDDQAAYDLWRKTNVIPQRQAGLFAVGVRVPLGDMWSPEVRKFAELIRDYAADEFRFTLRQNFLIRHVREDLLPYFYQQINALGFGLPGFQSVADVTSCPGTDTCNLGISASTGLAREVERLILADYPQLLSEKGFAIKISGCMNSCSQHNMASIGFHGAGMKAGANQVPASFILLGGHTIGDGEARLADKIVKIPSKRCPEALTRVLNHFIAERAEGEKFGDYYQRFGAEFYGQLFADLADTTVVTDNELIDWGRDGIYEARDKDGKKVTIDLIVTLFEEGREKIENAEVAIAESRWADSISHSYWVLVNTAKALLLTVGAKTNSRAQITEAFEEKFGDNPALGKGFGELVYQIKHNEPSEEFARKYLAQTKALITSASAFYQEQKASN